MYVVEERGFTPYNHSACPVSENRSAAPKNEDSLRWGMTPNQRISELRGAGCRQLHRAPVEGGVDFFKGWDMRGKIFPSPTL